MEEWPKGQSNSLDCCNNRNSQFIYQRHYHILVKSSYKKPPFLIKAFIPLQNKNQIYCLICQKIIYVSAENCVWTYLNIKWIFLGAHKSLIPYSKVKNNTAIWSITINISLKAEYSPSFWNCGSVDKMKPLVDTNTMDKETNPKT